MVRIILNETKDFILHPQLSADTIPLGNLPLCRVLLMNNAQFPWLILVPRREGLRELFELTLKDYNTAMEEVRKTAQTFSQLMLADKMNIAALGNIVPQLHIHIIARFKTDAAWPHPVWNSSIKPEPYASTAHTEFCAKIRQKLNITKM